MATSGQVLKEIRLTEKQSREGYKLEVSENNVLVWHGNNQIALLLASPDINRKVRQVIEKRRRDLRDVERKTGWKPEQT